MGNWLHSLTSKLHVGTAESETSVESRNTRTSLGLEQFVPTVTEMEHPSVLDLGCVWQSTVSFFTREGCKLYTEDIFEVLHKTMTETRPDSAPLAERFFPKVLGYPTEHFRGIVGWDLFDRLPEELIEPLAGRLFELLEPGGALLLLCHNRKEDSSFARYRVIDQRTVELLPASLPLPVERIYSNRALLNLFGTFSSTRTFVGRDNFRELFLVK